MVTSSLLHYWIQSIANVEGDIALRQQSTPLSLFPLLNLLPPLVSSPVDVDELFIALVSDDGVLDLFLPPGDDLLFYLLHGLGIGYFSIQLRVSYNLPVVWKPPSDEDSEGKQHYNDCNDGEDETDTEGRFIQIL